MSFNNSRISRLSRKSDRGIPSQRASHSDIVRNEVAAPAPPISETDKAGNDNNAILEKNNNLMSPRSNEPGTTENHDNQNSKPVDDHSITSTSTTAAAAGKKIPIPKFGYGAARTSQLVKLKPVGAAAASAAANKKTSDNQVSEPKTATTPATGAAGKIVRSATMKSFRSPRASLKLNVNSEKKTLESEFNCKLRRLMSMKKDITDKQKPAIELYKTITALKKRIDWDDKDIPSLEEFRIVDFNENKRSRDGGNREVEFEQLKKMKIQLQAIPITFMELCRQILDQKCSIIDRVFDDETDWNRDEIMEKIQRYKMDTTIMEGSIEGKLKEEEARLKELIRHWQDLTKLGPGLEDIAMKELETKLQESEQRLKNALADANFEKTKKLKETEKVKELEKDVVKYKEKIQELNKNIEEEKSKSNVHKERQSTFDQKIRSAKMKIKESDQQRQDAELKIEQLQSIIKKSEDQWHAKETYFENRQKDLQKTLKNQELQIAKLESEKRVVDVRLETIEGEQKDKTAEYERCITELETKLKTADADVFILHQENDKLETHCEFLRAQMEKVDEFNRHIMARTNNEPKAMQGDTGGKTESELALWNELQKVKSDLRIAEEKLSLYADEKARLIDTIRQNYRNNDETANLAKHLMEKESFITELVLQNEELQKSFDKSMEENDQKNIVIKTLKENVEALGKQLYESTDDINCRILEMHKKWEHELERNTDLQKELLKSKSEMVEVKELLQDCENLLKIRDGLLSIVQEKKLVADQQNENLKEYIRQMRDQINMLYIQQMKKEEEIARLDKLLEDKQNYIQDIEYQMNQLEMNFNDLEAKRVNLQESLISADNQLKFTREELARLLPERRNSWSPSHEEFIRHVKTLSNQELTQFKQKINLKLATVRADIYAAEFDIQKNANSNKNIYNNSNHQLYEQQQDQQTIIDNNHYCDILQETIRQYEMLLKNNPHCEFKLRKSKF